MFQILKETATKEMRKEEIHQIQGGTIHTTGVIVDPEIKATVTTSQKTIITSIIHHAKDNS